MVYLDVTVAKLLILRSILKHTGLTHRSVVVFRRVTGLVFLQVVANIPTVVVEKPRDGQWGCKLFVPLQIDPVVRRHTSPATRRRWFLNHLFVGLGYDRTTADTSLRCALRPVIVVGVEYQTSAHGFAH